MIIIAMTLYLPQHIAFLTNRAWFYYNGDENAKLASISSVIDTATGLVLVDMAKETIVKAAVGGAGSPLSNVVKDL
ncbi:hypothetical protein G7Y89_g13465 [Cudoniella acicularis]|uniref:Uncharacterized protein n=1 Tax=Cudoniella acicularis TaxID=354080 RepID=A0A8H4R9J0_9HELO|nr:hypothetical protein G7Y89_g13465 [Cudoniella acicularis]